MTTKPNGLALVAGCLAGLALAGCSRDDRTTDRAAKSASEGPAARVTLRLTCGAVATDQKFCRSGGQIWSEKTGHKVEIVVAPSNTSEHLAMIQQLLGARSSDIDVFSMDVIWPGIFGEHLYDLSPHFSADYLSQYFQPILAGCRVRGKLVAIPWFTDAGLLYYRKDLLAKHDKSVPQTWAQLTDTAAAIMKAERKAGQAKMWGFVFQGRAYEGLTVNALEWIYSFGGGTVVDESGQVTINNPNAAAALEMAASWVGTIAPAGVLNYQEEDARGVWQTGNAVFMRNWPYAYAAGNAPGSPIRGAFGVAPLPGGGEGTPRAAGLGGWQLAVSKYSRHPEIAADLVRYLTGPTEQKRRATGASYNPTIPSLYRDADVLAANRFMSDLYDAFVNAVPRPSAVTGPRYNHVSSLFYKAVHASLSNPGTAARELAELEADLNRISRGGTRW
jgi:trehalose/maltose transport system substrate-binding protein